MKPPASVTIGGKRWRIKWCPLSTLPPDRYGDCDNPEKRRKTIRILKDLPDDTMIRVVFHEVIHAGLWPVECETVDNIAEAAASILTRLGFTRKENA